MKRSPFTPLLIAAALLWQLPAHADDIDVFTGAGSSATQKSKVYKENV